MGQANLNIELSSKKSMLKFKNFDSYLYGETQLVYFVELRKYLAARRGKKDKPLELVFLSLSANDYQQQGEVQKKGKEPTYEFPPLLNVSDRHLLEGNSIKKGGFGSSIASSNFEMRRNSTMRGEKSIDESIASRFRHVSIFSWYPPKKLADDTPKLQDGTVRNTIGGQRSKQHGYAKDTWQILKYKQNQGSNSFLKYPHQGYYSFSQDATILPSCDVYEPIKIKLLGVKNLCYSLRNHVEKTKGQVEKSQTLPVISYCEPAAETNSTVLDFLKACRDANQVDRAAIKGTLRPKLINDFANHGKNSFYTLGFSDIKFLLNKPHGKIKGKKLKEPFSFEPKYIQIQAALYLGCRRISCFSYSKPTLFGNTVELENNALTFWKPVNPNKL